VTPSEQLWQRWRDDADASARAELLAQHVGLVHHVVRQIAARVGDALGYDDLIGAGTLGLVQAFEGFDLTKGTAFSTYATTRIRGAVLDELRAADWRPRSVRTRARHLHATADELARTLGRTPTPDEVAEALGVDLLTYWRWHADGEQSRMLPLDAPMPSSERGTVTLADMLPDHEAEAPGAPIEDAEERAALREAIAALPEQQRTVLALCYFEELTLRQIAEVLHVTESRISQVRTAALKALRQHLTAAGGLR
jgi:RNA polymerase sigma factor for flagellar operon FliA